MNTTKRFADDERRLLLTTPGIGHGVISRMEHFGVHSLSQLRAQGIETIVEQICEGLGNLAWRNRKRALVRALCGLQGFSV